jgi:hypothetical protein
MRSCMWLLQLYQEQAQRALYEVGVSPLCFTLERMYVPSGLNRERARRPLLGKSVGKSVDHAEREGVGEPREV